MYRTLSEREISILCHPMVCSHLEKYWDLYGPIVDLAVTMRQLSLVKPFQIENLVKYNLDYAIAYTQLRTLPKVISPGAGITFDGLYLLFIWLFMSMNDYKKAPNNTPGGVKRCTI